jgi:hypothetical protein
MPTLVRDPPPSKNRHYPARGNRTPFPSPPKVITTHVDYTPLDHRSPSLPAIDELQTTIATLGDTATDEDNHSVLPQNSFSGIEAILQADKTASPPSSPGITSNEDFDRVKASDAAAPPPATSKTLGETNEDYDEFLPSDAAARFPAHSKTSGETMKIMMNSCKRIYEDSTPHLTTITPRAT